VCYGEKDDGKEKEMTDICQSLKDAGFIYREPDENDPRFQEFKNKFVEWGGSLRTWDSEGNIINVADDLNDKEKNR